MNHIVTMIDTHPAGSGPVDAELLAACIEACFDCAQTCTSCADACLAEEGVADLRECIGLNLDCADICMATGRILSRQGNLDAALVRAVVEVCRQACAACGSECEEHAGHHEHCKVCAEQCRRCEQACSDLLASLGR